MAWFADFTRRWASSGVTVPPSDTQADAGFAFLGANTPTVELFNNLFSDRDQRDRWLFLQLRRIMNEASINPTEAGGEDQTLRALRAMFARRSVVYGASGTFTIPPGVTLLHIRAWSGGGGGGGASGAGSAGAGGGGGGFAEGEYAVTPGAIFQVSVGGAGSGGSSNPAGAGTQGGTSSVGAFLSVTGGGGGLGAVGTITTAALGAGGVASNGNRFSLTGATGGFGFAVPNGIAGSVGGASPMGGNFTPPAVNGGATNGTIGQYPGGGGGGGVLGGVGGQGSAGVVILEY